MNFKFYEDVTSKYDDGGECNGRIGQDIHINQFKYTYLLKILWIKKENTPGPILLLWVSSCTPQFLNAAHIF